MLGAVKVEVNQFDPTPGQGTELLTLFLKLSQEISMDPGLLLPIAEIGMVQNDATGGQALILNDLWMAEGRIFAPTYVGVRQQEVGTLVWNVDVHLEYERVFLPWRDWFVHWELLDGVVNNARDY